MAKKGWYRSHKNLNRQRYESSYELRRFKALDEDPKVIEWNRHHLIVIKYSDGRKIRRYYPDIFVKQISSDGREVVYIEEVKGYRWDREKFGKKNAAALWFCQLRRRKGFEVYFRIIEESGLETVE